MDGMYVESGDDDDGCVKFRSLFSISAGALARRNCGKSGYTHDKSLIVSHDTVHTGTLVKNTQAGQTVREVHLDMLQLSVPPRQWRRRDAWRGGVSGKGGGQIGSSQRWDGIAFVNNHSSNSRCFETVSEAKPADGGWNDEPKAGGSAIPA